MKARDLIRMLNANGWQQERAHAWQPSAVSTSYKTGYNYGGRQREYRYPAGNVGEHLETARGRSAMKYMVVIEKGEASYGAHVPDLPGCIAVGQSREQVLGLIREAMEFHIEGLKEAGEPVPVPSSVSEYVDVNAA